jgi:hypothetical protein
MSIDNQDRLDLIQYRLAEANPVHLPKQFVIKPQKSYGMAD